MRGIPIGIYGLMVKCRIIPAHAGNTKISDSNHVLPKDHPRSCGEYMVQKMLNFIGQGSSPLMRGILDEYKEARDEMRIIPAHAGNTLRFYFI